jgi:glycosyltransferase involved in cell wall biosynthesis
MQKLYKIKSRITRSNHDVCVICCARNGSVYAKESLESVILQKSCAFKLMLLDDASEDSTLDVCSQILSSSEVDYEIYHVKNNLGVPSARNILISHCDCQFIAIHDIDDIMMPFRLFFQINFLKQFSDVHAVGGHAYKIDSQGNFIDTMSYPPRDNADILNMLPGRVNPMIDPTVMMRLHSFQKMNGYSENENLRLAQDFDLWIRMCKSGMRLANIQGPLTIYRVSDSGLTVSKKNDMIKAHVYVQSIHKSFLEQIRSINGKSK